MKIGQVYVKQPVINSRYRDLMKKFKDRMALDEMPVTATIERIYKLVKIKGDDLKEWIVNINLFDNQYMPVQPIPDYRSCLEAEKIMKRHKVICERLKKIDERRSMFVEHAKYSKAFSNFVPF